MKGKDEQETLELISKYEMEMKEVKNNMDEKAIFLQYL